MVPAQLPDGAKQIETNGDVILAYGEVTGHAHRIKESTKVRMWSAGAERFLQVMEAVALTHEEHTALTIPPGVYKLPQQVEYTPAELKRVAD
jgi:hypothetical protein